MRPYVKVGCRSLPANDSCFVSRGHYFARYSSPNMPPLRVLTCPKSRILVLDEGSMTRSHLNKEQPLKTFLLSDLGC